MKADARADSLNPRRLGIDTHQEPVVYMRADCHVCRSEGFAAHSRVEVRLGGRSITATLNVVHGELLGEDEVGFSEAAWQLLQPQPSERARFAHPVPVDSMSYVRAKVYNQRLAEPQLNAIISDVVANRYTDVELAAFIASCADGRLSRAEITSLTRAMVNAGERLTWPYDRVMDKHCVGGLAGNRTTMILVPIAACLGLIMPKTSSRAITSPSGTADTMETLAPVDLSLDTLRAVVEREGACIAWGGAIHLSPADDILVRVERALDLDSEGQLVASVLSKKSAAGSTHVVLDLPVGPTAKVRSQHAALGLQRLLEQTARAIGLKVKTLVTDGRQPVGRGVGPALEARDVLAVLRNEPGAPQDLRAHSLDIAAALVELAEVARGDEARSLVTAVLQDGRALAKLEAICDAQGGMRQPPVATHTHDVAAMHAGRITAIDNRLLSRAAKLAGAPHAKAAGLELLVRLDERVSRGQPLFRLHAENAGDLDYALEFVQRHPGVVQLERH
ncbi:MAG TPA: thymidine phosphorylase family protein [Gammaproteobacteria bacterium]|nr:thymidine phosphorylase family protein [Gammaproteobacteria bacterium]